MTPLEGRHAVGLHNVKRIICTNALLRVDYKERACLSCERAFFFVLTIVQCVCMRNMQFPRLTNYARKKVLLFSLRYFRQVESLDNSYIDYYSSKLKIFIHFSFLLLFLINIIIFILSTIITHSFNFHFQDVELSEGMIPEDTMEVEVSHCRELRIQAGAFSGGAQLKRVHVSGIYTLVANKQAFQNITAPNPLLEVSECNRVILESHAFKNTKGPLSVSISRCKHVTIKPNAFSWLLHISVREVPNLELSSNAFKFETPQHGRHGPATKVNHQHNFTSFYTNKNLIIRTNH